MKVPPAAGSSLSAPASPPVLPPSARAGGALVPVTRVPAAEEVGANPRSPFDRAGVDVGALLVSAGDSLVARPTPSTAALSAVLERARAALVRGAAPEALAALDDAWEGASRTEGGWYYRAAALAALGRAADAERVLHTGLATRQHSAALLFLRSLLEDGSGNAAAALASEQAASALRPDTPLLAAWRAVLLARLGDRRGSSALLRMLGDSGVPPSLLEWVRAAIARAGAASGVASGGASGGAWGGAPGDVSPGVSAGASATRRASGAAASFSGARGLMGPALEQSLQRLGAALLGRPAAEVRDDIQSLIRAMSVGGTLHATARPEPLAAARTLMASLLAVYAVPTLLEGATRAGSGRRGHPRSSQRWPAQGRSVMDALADSGGVWRMTPTDRPACADDLVERPMQPPVQDPVQHPVEPPAHSGDPSSTSASWGARHTLLTALRAGELAEAHRLLATMHLTESATVLAAARALLCGAESRASGEPGALFGAATARTTSGLPATHTDASVAPIDPVTGGEPHYPIGTWIDPLLTGVRLGLALLHFPSAHREAVAALGSTPVRGTAPRGGTRSASASSRRGHGVLGSSRVVTLTCLGGAILATVAGVTILALPLLAAAVWVGLADRPDRSS